MRDFLERLNEGEILIFDGGMGSMLAQGGATEGAGLANLSHPHLVRSIHQAYVQAGAECLITNTLTLNSLYLAKSGQAQDCEKALQAGIEQALSAADGRAYVFGDMGPSGELLAPYGPGQPAAFHQAFGRVAEIFAAYPLAGIIIETVFSLAEAEIMLAACREAAPQLPVILSMTFAQAKGGGRTIMGDKASVIAQKARAGGACAVGTNCGELSPPELAGVLQAMNGAELPMIAQPNAGKPELKAGQAVYALEPADFARQMLALKQAGALMLGGCCGTTPAHIEALAKAVK